MMMLRKKKYLLVLIALLAVAILDKFASWYADKHIQENDYFFSERLERENLNFVQIDSAPRKLCSIDHVFHIYPFQTCFLRFTASVDPNDWGYRFIYSRPRPRLALVNRGDSEDNYYFSEAGDGPFGSYVRFIQADGKIRE